MEAVIYSNGNQECERAKTLLEKLNFQISVYKLNQHFSQRGFVAEFGEEAEYPQVNVGFRHIGGIKKILTLLQGQYTVRPTILLACLSPILIIWIVMKLALWLYATEEEREYVAAESKKPHGPYVADAYADVDEEEEEYGDRTDYR